MAFEMQNKSKPVRRTAQPASTLQEEDEYAGLWINVGVEQAIDGAAPDENGDYAEGDTSFVRLPRGIAVSDLKNHRLFASTNPEWASEAQLANSIMDVIRERGLELEEGESVPISLQVRLYRRQEQVEQVADRKTTSNLADQLFG